MWIVDGYLVQVEDLTWALRVSGTAKFGSNCGQDIRLRFGHDVKLFDRDFEADF